MCELPAHRAGVRARDRVVAVSAGGETEVLQRGEDGAETAVRQRRPADIGVLVVAINRLLEDSADIDERLDRAVFRLAADRLAEAEQQYRQQRSEQLIRSATRKAVIGSLAAVSPGTDVLIGRKRLRIPSGASGFGSHMSIWGGPPQR